jgi:PAS domain S-box-containing protein
LTQQNRVTAVMITGHRGSEPMSRELLDIFLAVAGLFETTLARLASQHLLVSLADNVPEMLFQLVRYPDGEETFSYVSRGARAVLGMAPEALQVDVRAFRDKMPAEDRDALMAQLTDSAANGSRITHEFSWPGPDGTARALSINAMPTLFPDGTVTWDGAIQDITERKEAEEERRRNAEKLKTALVQTIQAVSHTVEKRDPYTAGHQRQVALLAAEIGREMGLPEDCIDGLYMGGLIHDIGKISVPAEVLTRPGRLSEIEFALIKTHPEAGYDIIKGVDLPWPVAQMILQHHERLDGSGYPRGLKDDQIIPEARILAVADVVEAMAAHRPYRPSRGLEEALEEIERNAGRSFDPEAVSACLRLFRDKGFRLEQTLVAAGKTATGETP